jgi:Protein of unknown function (DUF3667)
MSDESELLEHACPNCEQLIAHPLPNFCSHCGQETTLKPPTVVEFLQQFGGSIIATEGALWRTIKLLLLRPGQLTLEYLNGRRRRYILPLRLFLTLSVIALLLMRLMASFGGPTLAEIESSIIIDQPEQNEGSSITIGASNLAIRDNKVTCTGLPEAWCDRIKERFVLEPKAIAKRLKDLPSNVLSHAGLAMFLLLPLFAGLLKIVYFSRHMRWTEHMIFALHLHAFWFAMMIVQLTGVPAVIAIPFYSVIAANAVYGGSRWSTCFRWAGLGLLYGLMLCLTFLAMTIWAFMFA